VEETLEHTGLGGKIKRRPNAAAHRQAEGAKFFRTHPPWLVVVLTAVEAEALARM